MSDVHTEATRSFNMSQVKGKNTKPELIVRSVLHAGGFRYKLHDKTLPGKPDLVFPKFKIAIFVNGCFWHMHENCKYFVVPKTRTEWWLNKIERNVLNDTANLVKLKNLGWDVITIWECELKPAFIDKTMNRLTQKLISLKKKITKDFGVSKM